MRSVKITKQQKEKEIQEEKKMQQLEDQEQMQRQSVNSKLDKNVVPKLEQKDTYNALRQVELQQQLDVVDKKIKNSTGIEFQLLNKKAMLLFLAIQIEEDDHPIFNLIKHTNKQLKENKETHDEFVEASNLVQIDQEPVEEMFGAEEQQFNEMEDSEDSAISLSELPNYVKVSKDKEINDMTSLTMRKAASLGEADTVGRTLEERARQLKQEQRQLAKQEKPQEDFFQKAQNVNSKKESTIPTIQQKKQISSTKKPWIEDKATAGKARTPTNVILRNKNAIEDNVGKKQKISKLKLKKQFKKYETGKSAILRDRRTSKQDGYFGESNIVMKK